MLFTSYHLLRFISVTETVVLQIPAIDGTLEDRRGIYRHPIIQTAINDMWFVNQSDEGVQYKKYFSPIPIATMALVLTVVRASECSKCDVLTWNDRHRTVLMSGGPEGAFSYRLARQNTLQFTRITLQTWKHMKAFVKMRTRYCLIYARRYIVRLGK